MTITGRTWVRKLAIALGALIVFMFHFRPWEVAFLEEWPLAEYWTDKGPVQFARHYFEWSLSRPLHLVPTEIGLALGGGAPGGIFFMLGLVAAAQFAMILWCVRKISGAFWISTAVGLFVALHPLWPAGFLQRFLPAQTAALSLIVAAGLMIRWLQRGGTRSLVLTGVTLLLGLCVYPGPAVAAPLLALVIALAVPSTFRRRLVGVLVVAGISAAMAVYSLAITRLIAPTGGGYEESNFTAGTSSSPRVILTDLATAIVEKGSIIVAGVLVIAVLGAVLALIGAVPPWAGWLISGTAVLSPLCSIVFFANVSWLTDIDRIGYATSLGLIAALLVWPITSLGVRSRPQELLAALFVIAAVGGAVRGVQHWQPYIQLQHHLLAELAPLVKDATGNEVVYVVDHSGTYGSQYTLPQHYINSASHVMNGDKTEVWLCRLASDPPLDSASVCNPSDPSSGMALVKTFHVPSGEVEIYIGGPVKGE